MVMAGVDVDRGLPTSSRGGEGDMPIGDAREVGRTKSSILIGSTVGDCTLEVGLWNCDISDDFSFAACSLNLFAPSHERRRDDKRVQTSPTGI